MNESRTRALGDANAMFFATRYDYLRISKSIMDDWQNDTCVGKYLKTIYENRVPKTGRPKDEKDSWTNPTGYAGQFHTNCYTEKKLIAICKRLGLDIVSIDKFQWKGDRDHMLELKAIKK